MSIQLIQKRKTKLMYTIGMAFGGKKNLGFTPKKNADFESLMRNGMPISAADHLKEVWGLTDKELACLIGLSQSTLTRKRKSGKKLPPKASPGLIRLAQVFAFAVDVLGNEDDALKWLNSANPVLGRRIPMDMVKTEAGAEEVRDLLSSIRYGGAV